MRDRPNNLFGLLNKIGIAVDINKSIHLPYNQYNLTTCRYVNGNIGRILPSVQNLKRVILTLISHVYKYIVHQVTWLLSGITNMI